MSILQVTCLEKIYTARFGAHQVKALSNVNFSVEEGEYVAIMGESGSGKTTLLNILAALDKAAGGQVFLEGKELGGIPERELAAFRRENLGFVFQEFNLLDTFSLEDNILLPLVLAGMSYSEMQKRLLPLVEKLGIADQMKKYPYEVSGGQKQRAAVARALITRPALILADEPTGALDSRASDALLELFGAINSEGQTILMVTHSVKAASHAKRVLFLRDGEIYHQLYRAGQSCETMYQKISDTLTVIAGQAGSREATAGKRDPGLVDSGEKSIGEKNFAGRSPEIMDSGERISCKKDFVKKSSEKKNLEKEIPGKMSFVETTVGNMTSGEEAHHE